MDLEEARLYLLSKPEAFQDYPFGPDVAVMKIADKMFATLAVNSEGLANCNLKCDPEEATMLRDIFVAIKPGYHMNKRHWNTVDLQGDVPTGEIQRMIDRSYSLVVRKLTRAQRQALEIRHGREVLYGKDPV